MREFHDWTPEEKAFLWRYVKKHTWKETTEEFNRRFGCNLSVSSVKSTGKRYGIRTGRTGQFEAGNIPANKGIPMETKGRMAETQFKKGNMPQTHLPVGSVTIRRYSDKRKKPYMWEKVEEPNKWRMKHVLEWERHNGPVPEGMIVIFADGDTLNPDISNLIIVTKAQHAVMNSHNLHGCDKEHAEMAANIASLKIEISKRKKSIKYQTKRKKRDGKMQIL